MSKKGNRSTSASAAFVVVNIGELTAAHASGGGTVRAEPLHPGKDHAKHPAMGKGSRSRARSRSWLMEDNGTYEMVCYGGHLEMEHDGCVVWKGKATEGGFETTSTSLPAGKCATLLDLALVGEKVKYGAHSGPSRATESEPIAKRSAAKKTTASKKPTAKKTAPKKPTAKKPTAKKTAPKKPTAAESKSVAAVETYTVSGQHGETVVRKDVRIQRPAGVTQKAIQGILDGLAPGKSRLSTVIKRLAKHGAAFVPWDDGKPGDSGAYEIAAKKAPAKKAPPPPESGSRPSKRGKRANAAPPTSGSTDLVDDAQFLDDLRAELKKAGAENLFETAKALWQAGGRQKALEHMAATKGRSLVKAFLDWMDKHEQDAQAMLAARAS